MPAQFRLKYRCTEFRLSGTATAVGVIFAGNAAAALAAVVFSAWRICSARTCSGVGGVRFEAGLVFC
jgi:hypothetical protein